VFDAYGVYSPFLHRTQDGIHYLLDVVTIDAETLLNKIFATTKRPSHPMELRKLY
jgi:hypothetical protein